MFDPYFDSVAAAFALAVYHQVDAAVLSVAADRFASCGLHGAKVIIRPLAKLAIGHRPPLLGPFAGSIQPIPPCREAPIV